MEYPKTEVHLLETRFWMRQGTRILTSLLLLMATCFVNSVLQAQAPGDDQIKLLAESYFSDPTKVQVVTPSPGATPGTVYYVSPAGDDGNSGTSSTAPWQTISKVNAKTFSPGDMILFQAGSTWNLTTPLHPLGSGSAAAPIVIGAYGSGLKPTFTAKTIAVPFTFWDGTTHYASEVLYLFNQQYIEVRDLDISNTPDGYTGVASAAQAALLTDRRGMHVAGGSNTATTVLQGINIHDNYIHDVAGEIEPIGVNGFDAGKRTAGILFEVVVMGSNGLPVSANPVDVTGFQPTSFSNVTIQNNVIARNSYGGIILHQLQNWGGLRGSGSAPDYNQSWYPNTAFTISQNYLDQNKDDYGANTLLGIGLKSSTVTHNVSSGAGTSAMEMDSSDQITIEWNEIYGALQKVTGSDSNAIDSDREATNILVQYNYLHNNGDGILLSGITYSSSVYRYNVIQDSDPTKRYINVHGDSGYNYIYNNVFYNSGSTAPTFVNSSGGSSYLSDSNNFEYFYNNIFYSPNAAATIATGSSLAFDRNSYYGIATIPSTDGDPIIGNPLLKAPSALTGGAGTTVNVGGLDLQPGSPLIAAAKVITSHPNTSIPVAPSTDIAGTPVPSSGVDVGVFVSGLKATPGMPPAAPSALTATAVSSSQINLVWSGIVNAATYSVLRGVTSGGPYYAIATNVTTPGFVDSSLSANTTFYYVVQAVNSYGTSSNSNQASAKTPGTDDLEPISLNFIGGGTAMAATESAGVVPETHWSNATGAAGSGLVLSNVLGAATGATVTWTADHTSVADSSVKDTAGNYRMIRGTLTTSNTSTTTVTVAGLLPSPNGYNVYVYSAPSQPSGVTRVASYTISGTGITTTKTTVTANVTDFTGTFTQANNSVGNYVEYTIGNVSSFTIMATPVTASDGIPRAVINGIQIIPVPLSVNVSSTSMVYGSSVTTLSASLVYTGSIAPTGSLSFKVDSGTAVTATCSGNASPLTCTASYPTGTLPIGAHTITAIEGADTRYATTTGTGTLTVTAAPAGTPLVGAGSSITRQPDGSYLVAVTITNTGNGAASAVTLNTLTVGGIAGASLPRSLGSIQSGSSITTTVSVPSTAGNSGAVVLDKITGSYTGGTYSSSSRATLP